MELSNHGFSGVVNQVFKKIVGGKKGNDNRTEIQMKQITTPMKGNYSKGEPPVKRLSDAEFQARLDKGLYFRCNEKYSHGHRCKVKEKRKLMLFTMNEEEGEGEGNVLMEREEEVMELKNLKVPIETEIQMRTIMGFSSKGTMKLKGVVKDKEVLILIDSGATHNFIHQVLVEELKLTIEEGTAFGVTIGDGSNRRRKGLCQRVEVKLPELTIIADFLAVELG